VFRSIKIHGDAEMSEIGREQFCAQYHRDSLREIAYSQTRNKIATCNLNCVKIVDMSAWKVSRTHDIVKLLNQIN
jgi:hypothetical protein